MKEFDEMTQQEQARITEAWSQVTAGLKVYAELTGQDYEYLKNRAHDIIWNEEV